MLLQARFPAPGEDAIIIGRPQRWSYSGAGRGYRKAYTIEFHPASKCAFECGHCQGAPFRDSFGSTPLRISQRFVSQFFSAYDARADKSLGIWKIIISGMTGEPLLNKHAVDSLLEGVRAREMAVGLSTSGLHLGEREIGLMARSATEEDWLNLSLDAPLGRGERQRRLYNLAHGLKSGDALSKVMRNMEAAAELKYKIGSKLQINIDWILTDLCFETPSIEEDIVESVKYLGRLPGISSLRFQMPFYLHEGVPMFSDRNNDEVARVMGSMQEGKYELGESREDFIVKIRKNWYKRLDNIRACTAGRDYGVVFGPDELAYYCPYTAAPAFKRAGANLPHVNAQNLWDVIEEIKPLDVEGMARCRMVCALKDCFVELGIVT